MERNNDEQSGRQGREPKLSNGNNSQVSGRLRTGAPTGSASQQTLSPRLLKKLARGTEARKGRLERTGGSKGVVEEVVKRACGVSVGHYGRDLGWPMFQPTKQLSASCATLRQGHLGRRKVAFVG